MKWNTRWTVSWLLLLATFVNLELEGEEREAGESTLSEFLVSNLGWKKAAVLTIIGAGVLCWHWKKVLDWLNQQ